MLCKAVLAVLLAVAVAGCATMSNKPPVDQKAGVKKVMEQWKTAMEAKNVDEVMNLLSPKAFKSPEFGGYAEFKDNLGKFIADGKLDNAKIDLDTAQITVEDEKATVYPVGIKAAFGEGTLSFQLRREEGKWLIVNMAQG
jgi:hypothetical protein